MKTAPTSTKHQTLNGPTLRNTTSVLMILTRFICCLFASITAIVVFSVVYDTIYETIVGIRYKSGPFVILLFILISIDIWRYGNIILRMACAMIFVTVSLVVFSLALLLIVACFRNQYLSSDSTALLGALLPFAATIAGWVFRRLYVKRTITRN